METSLRNDIASNLSLIKQYVGARAALDDLHDNLLEKAREIMRVRQDALKGGYHHDNPRSLRDFRIADDGLYISAICDSGDTSEEFHRFPVALFAMSNHELKAHFGEFTENAKLQQRRREQEELQQELREAQELIERSGGKVVFGAEVA